MDPDIYDGVYGTVVQLCAIVSSSKDCDDEKFASDEDIEDSLCFINQAVSNDNSLLSSQGVKKLCEQRPQCGPTNYSQGSDSGYSTGCNIFLHISWRCLFIPMGVRIHHKIRMVKTKYMLNMTLKH